MPPPLQTATRLQGYGWLGANYLRYEPQQTTLLPETLREWLPEGHLAHFISDAIDGLVMPAVGAGGAFAGTVRSIPWRLRS